MSITPFDTQKTPLPTCSVKNFLNDRLDVIEGDYIGEIIKEKGAFSYRELCMLASIFTHLPLTNCLEVGANIGNHTSLFSRFFKTTFAFEPNPFIYKILSTNIQRNNLQAIAYDCGLSNEAAELDFYVDKKNFGASSFVKKHVFDPSTVIKASVAVGDKFIEQKQIADIDYIKIDAEGLEGKIVQGLRKTIERYQPIISLEWNCAETRNDFEKNNLFTTILDGYSIHSIIKSFPKNEYSGVIQTLQRFMLRHVIHRNQKLVLGTFYQEKDYDMVVLFPSRFRTVPKQVRYSEKLLPR